MLKALYACYSPVEADSLFSQSVILNTKTQIRFVLKHFYWFALDHTCLFLSVSKETKELVKHRCLFECIVV